MKSLENVLSVCQEKNDNEFTVNNLLEIEGGIQNTLNKIKACNSLDEAEVHFNLLDKAQFFLAKMSFKEKVPLSVNLRKFVYDFDRLDDLEQKEYLYSTIKSGGDYFIIGNDNTTD